MHLIIAVELNGSPCGLLYLPVASTAGSALLATRSVGVPGPGESLDMPSVWWVQRGELRLYLVLI